MLVIRRRAGESLLLGDNIEIEVLEVGPTKVKLGIVAPNEVLILRKEAKLTREQNLIAVRGFTEKGIRSLLSGLRSAASATSTDTLPQEGPRQVL